MTIPPSCFNVYKVMGLNHLVDYYELFSHNYDDYFPYEDLPASMESPPRFVRWRPPAYPENTQIIEGISVSSVVLHIDFNINTATPDIYSNFFSLKQISEQIVSYYDSEMLSEQGRIHIYSYPNMLLEQQDKLKPFFTIDNYSLISLQQEQVTKDNIKSLSQEELKKLYFLLKKDLVSILEDTD
jgi:hypothetical protein